MVTRRALLQAGMTLPFASGSLIGCSRQAGPVKSYYRPEMYLENNYGPVDVETTLTELTWTGSIPTELTGRFLRNGPNPLNEVDPVSHHWFIGDGMVHGLRLENGRADWYRNRWVRSEGIVAELGEEVGNRNLSAGSPNTHVIGHAGRTWAIVESGTPPVELSYELETIGHSPKWGAFTAHPKVDRETNELHAISYDWARYRDHVKYVVMDAEANTAKVVDIPMPAMSMIHDMSITKNFVVIYDFPVTLSFMALATGSRFPFRWDPEHEARVGLMPRNGGPEEIVWSPVSQSYAYHPMNAYETEGGNVIVDICRYDRMFDGDINGPFGDSTPKLDRWEVSPTLRKVTETRVDDRDQEFPRCHPDLNGKAYRYGYTVAAEGNSFPRLFKHDMQTGDSSSFEFGPGRHGSEPYFVPKESATSEDDGYLMTYVYDEARNASELIILDALDMSRPALAQIRLPVRVPFGFHGSWIADGDLTAV